MKTDSKSIDNTINQVNIFFLEGMARVGWTFEIDDGRIVHAVDPKEVN